MAESITSIPQQSLDKALSGLAITKNSIYFSSSTQTADNGGQISGFYNGTTTSVDTTEGAFVGVKLTLKWTRIAVYNTSYASSIAPAAVLMSYGTTKVQKSSSSSINWQTATSPGTATWIMNPMLVAPSDGITQVGLGMLVGGQIIKVKWSVSGYVYVWKFSIQS